MDLCSSRYCRYPQMSCLGMNSGRGWNPNLERSYLLEYRESDSHFWIQASSGFYIRPLKFFNSETSPILRYSKCTKTFRFSILGFFKPRVKLGFEFLRVLPNQKSQPWYPNFDFYEKINPMPGPLKSSSSVKSHNFTQQKLKMSRIKFCFNKKMRSSMKS